MLEAGSAAKRLRDPLGMREQQARLFLALGRRDDAAAAYRALIAINTENHKYHAGLLAALQLPAAGAAGAAGAAARATGAEPTEEQRHQLAEAYTELQREHPHSVAARRIPLDFLVGHQLLNARLPPTRSPRWRIACSWFGCCVASLPQVAALPGAAWCRLPDPPPPLPRGLRRASMQEGDAFVAAADAYVRKYLLRGIPSLFSGAQLVQAGADSWPRHGAGGVPVPVVAARRDDWLCRGRYRARRLAVTSMACLPHACQPDLALFCLARRLEATVP